ncbi:hypothetical protein MMYC01_207206 [Madurella mycetomatis]|uniref:CENP-V/GFA domain-containing protein n=1 Tax=Madurella mycetomatis TaxID=100816 RepID=A0A175W0Y9_9PEZI|nr:hypothetical protein MMYC01_207206 [Madurella mycetomatis]
MDASKTIIISCHCGQTRQTLALRGNGDPFSDVLFCHCDTCRHVTGQLFTSYLPLSPVPRPNARVLQAHPTTPRETRYFCPACGCHVFRLKHPSDQAAEEWDVATGVILDAPEPDPSTAQPKEWRHRHINDTKDGGLSIWMPNAEALPPTIPHLEPDDSPLLASCHCKLVSLSITRPSRPVSSYPDSPFPDLLLPYCSTPPSTVANPSKSKWYLRETPPPPSHPGTTTHPEYRYRYLAGTCACASCRLTSGFEIQSWAFIPLQNIRIKIRISPGSAPIPNPNPHPGPITTDTDTVTDTNEDTDTATHSDGYVPLDFASPATTLRIGSYSSSPNVARDFCRRCGATLFWHDTHRAQLIDVSAGLLGAAGARAEDWLEWWTGRTSFSEEAGKGRQRGALRFGEGVVKGLEACLMRSRGPRE